MITFFSLKVGCCPTNIYSRNIRHVLALRHVNTEIKICTGPFLSQIYIFHYRLNLLIKDILKYILLCSVITYF